MLTDSLLKKYDGSDMHVTYDNWPEIANESYSSSNEIGDFKNIDHLVFCGMGGSGTICDVFASILSKSDFHICIVKGYHLPSTIDSNTLVITSSVSGNTMETLQVLESANKYGCKTISFSSGGKMQTFCEKNNLPFKKIPIFHSPRASLPSFLYAMMHYFGPMFKIRKVDVLESIKSLENLRQNINSVNLDSNNISFNLAKWLVGFPIIYYPWGLQSAAIRFKNSLQENTKMHAMAEDIMEASHNGVVAWETHSNVQPILIQGADDYIKTKERWKIFEKYFYENKIDFYKIQSINGNILSKLVSLIYLLDYASIYKAFLNKIDPTPTNSIDYIKNKL